MAAHTRLEIELQFLLHLKLPKSKSQVKRVFDVILKDVTERVELSEAEIRSLTQTAEELYVDGDHSIQAMTFEFMKKLITIFERSPGYLEQKGPILKKLLAFYFRVVFRYSRRDYPCVRAAQHAMRCCKDRHPYQMYAREAVEVDQFVHYPLEKFGKKTVKNLLSLASGKISCGPHSDALMPGTVRFLNEVCAHHDTCGFVIRVCNVLIDIFRALESSKRAAELSQLPNTRILGWIISHVTPPRSEEKCWKRVANFLGEAFSFADPMTRMKLVSLDVFPIIYAMLGHSSAQVTRELLEVVRVVCGGLDPQYINHVLDQKILSRILSLVDSARWCPYRYQACGALNAFLSSAEPSQMRRALEDGMAASLVRLLGSNFELVVMDAMIWLFALTEAFRHEKYCENLMFLKRLVRESQGDQALLKLTANEKKFIKNTATIVRERLLAPVRPLTAEEEARRKAENKFIYETLPPAHQGLSSLRCWNLG